MMNKDQKIARGLRYGIVYSFFKRGIFNKYDSMQLLSGPLTPGDDSTIVDDSWLMNIDDPEKAVALIFDYDDLGHIKGDD